MEENTFGDFYKAEFDIDEFLNKQTETNELKEILHSLNAMKSKNTNQMTTVLREKTDAVILIAEQLQSLYKKIDNLQSPLAQLKEEVQILAMRVYDIVNSYDKCAIHSHNIEECKHNLTAIRAYKLAFGHTHKLMENFLKQDEVDFDALERLICKYAFHAFILNKLNIVDADAERLSINVSIKEILRKTFLKAHNTGNSNKITRIIDMFVYLGMLDKLKEIVCSDIVKPKVAPIFCEENLKACGNDMRLVYGQALRVLQHDLRSLITIVREENVPLDVILECYWSVVDKLLRTNLTSITAAGHPDAFFKHFNDTHTFLVEVGAVHGTPELYKQHHSLIEHLKRFNLLVYYEIRHQYVSSSFELVLLKCAGASDVQQLQKVSRTKNPAQAYNLKASLALGVLVEYLFSKKVFLSVISEQFTKSAMLLTARYSNWVQECLVGALRQYARAGANVAVAVWLISDVQLLRARLPAHYDRIDAAVDAAIRRSLVAKLEEDFAHLYALVAEYLVTYHLGKMKDDLKNVSDIPRLYRKTNRSVPAQCSPYVVDALREVENLRQMPVKGEAKSVSSKRATFGDEHHAVLCALLQSATKEYNAMVHSVLNAVFKTEESLKRLKSRNLTAAESGASSGSSDEGKIRLQIKLDVQQFVGTVRGFKLNDLQQDLQELLVQIENC